MENVTSTLINLGFGGAMVAAQVWFLMHLVTKTLPSLTSMYREELAGERAARREEVKAVLEKFDRLMERIGRYQETVLDRLDYGFGQLIDEVAGRVPRHGPLDPTHPRRRDDKRQGGDT